MIFNSQGDAELRQYINGQTITPGEEEIILPGGSYLLGDVIIAAVEKAKPYAAELTHLESTGTQYINTGFVPNQDTRIEMDVIPMSIAEAGNGSGFIPYGAAISYNNSAFECYTTASKLSFNYDGQYVIPGAVSVGEKIHISHNKNVIQVSKAGSVLYSHTFNYKAFTAPRAMTLFATNRNSPLCGLQRILPCQIYDNSTLIRDYIPVLDYGGIACLFDKVEQKFYYNQGSGSFKYA